MTGMRFTPIGYGGHRRDTEQVKRDGWKEEGLLAVMLDDHRLTWPERELVRQLGDKLYGKRQEGNHHAGLRWRSRPRTSGFHISSR